MQIVSSREGLEKALIEVKTGGKTLALVPTMGALHRGHLALVAEARARADRVAVSIFVNPRQFGPNEDLDAYPRRLAEDARLLTEAGADLLWAPTVGEVYPEGFATSVSVGGLDAVLCGAHRPGHFDGVATVVLKLFNQIRPDVAIFGEKDWQQLAIIRRMARDLDLSQPPVDAIIGLPTVREDDGLALSSRNLYLTPAERQQAPALNRAMREAIRAIEAGENSATALDALRTSMLAAGFGPVDYADLRDAETLETIPPGQPLLRPARLLVAAHLGKARMIDNLPVGINGSDRPAPSV